MPRCNDDEPEKGGRSSNNVANGPGGEGDDSGAENGTTKSESKNKGDGAATGGSAAGTENQETGHGRVTRSKSRTGKQADARPEYQGAVQSDSSKKPPSQGETKGAEKKQKVDKSSIGSPKGPDINAGERPSRTQDRV